MKEMPSGDPYVEHILAKVPGKVARTLTPQQWEGFREGLRQASVSPNHLLHIRFTLPLYFVRLYCVCIIGKDRRERVDHILFERRRRMGKIARALFLAAILVVLVAVAIVVLYILKSAAGVDLVPNFHFGDWLPGDS